MKPIVLLLAPDAPENRTLGYNRIELLQRDIDRTIPGTLETAAGGAVPITCYEYHWVAKLDGQLSRLPEEELLVDIAKAERTTT